ncbi:MAG: MFS transporter [Anaerolineaceae bacterium]|nr:MFS transporter [Anaerolineaceae bacterium]
MTQQAERQVKRQPGGNPSELTKAETGARRSSRRLRIALAWLSFVFLGIPGGAIGVAWPAIRDTWSLPTAWLGILLVAFTGGYLCGAFVSGRVITRLGLGNALLLSSVIIALGLASFGLSPTWGLLIVTAYLLGTGQGILDAGINLYFANHFSARMMNWLHAFFSIGAAMGPFTVQLVGTTGEGWRLLWLSLALGQTLLTAGFLQSRGQWLHSPETTASRPEETPSTLATLRRPLVLLGMALFFVFVGIESTAGSWSFVLFSETRGFDDRMSATWAGLYWIAFALGRIAYGFIADRFVSEKAVRLLFLAILLGALMFSMRDFVEVSVAGLLLIGMAQAPIFPLLITATPGRLGTGHATNAVGFQISAAGLGIACLPALVGYLATLASLEILGPFLAVSALLCLILFHFITRQGQGRHT